MIHIHKVHHIAIICSDYERSKRFYTEVLGFRIDQEIYREARRSYKADLSLHGQYIIELFSFPTPPSRLTQPEATGLRHIAFEVEDIHESVAQLQSLGIDYEPLRTDEFTGKQFTFITDPDHLPLELYQQ